MRQRSLDNILSDQNDSYRYSFGFHYTGEEANPELLDFIHNRFEIWNICSEEKSDTGLRHLQCYGETKTELTKSERQMFQGKGRYRKFLNTEVTKCWWFAKAKKDRLANVIYVLKDVKSNHTEERTILLNLQHDVNDLLNWIDQSHDMWHTTSKPPVHQDPRTFQDKLFYWYRDLPVDERPVRIKCLIEKMLRAKIVPWQNFPPRNLIAAAEAVLLNCTEGEVYENALSAKLQRVMDFYDHSY